MGDANWTDYTITCKVKFFPECAGDTDAGIMYRVKDALTHYIYDFNLDQGFIWAARINGTYLQAGAGMRVAMPLKAERFYELKVEVKGDETIAYVDGEKKLAFSHKQLQKDQMLDKGAVGIRIFLLVSTPQAFGGGELPFRKLCSQGSPRRSVFGRNQQDIWNSHAAFDDFEVNGPGIERSGAVSPAGKLAISCFFDNRLSKKQT